MASRKIPFCKELYIERDDFMIEPPKKYFRLFPGNEVRLMHAYFVKCASYETDENGNVTVVHCTYDPETKAEADLQDVRSKVRSTGWQHRMQNRQRYVCMKTWSMKKRVCIMKKTDL